MNSPPRPAYRADITCFRCGEYGHRKVDCLHWRTRLCWHSVNASCSKANCPLAHSREQLRAPWVVRCVRIVRNGDGYSDVGCGSFDHSFRSCPLANAHEARHAVPGLAKQG